MTKRINRLVSAITDGGDSPSLGVKLRELVARQRQIEVDRAALRLCPDWR